MKGNAGFILGSSVYGKGMIALTALCLTGLVLASTAPAVSATETSPEPVPLWNYSNPSTTEPNIEATQPYTTTKMPAKREFKKRIKPRRIPVFAPVPKLPQ